MLTAWDSLLKQLVALIFLNIIALLFDGQWLYVAVGLDCAALGYNFAMPSIQSKKVPVPIS